MTIILVAVGLFNTSQVRAESYFDDFSTVNNLSTFGSVTTSVDINTLTATRVTGGIDSGFDWNPGGAGNYFSLEAADSQYLFSLDATEPVNGGAYHISVLIWDVNDIFLGEITLQSDTSAIGTYHYDIATAAADAAYSTAAQWSAHIRIQPYAADNVAFKFQNFTAVPEPSSLTLLAVSGLAILTRRRRP